MAVFLSVPFAMQEMRENSLLKDVLRTYAKQSAHPLACEAQHNLAYHDAGKDVGCYAKTAFCAVRGDVYRPLRRVNKGKVEGNGQDANDGVERGLQSQASRGTPKPSYYFAI